MLNNNHKNSDCGFAEQLVSYLYGEITEDAAFIAHLETCSVCAEELEAFSSVHFSINDWKSKEFDNLETPVIKIPYETIKKAAPEQDVAKGNWWLALRALLARHSQWSLAAASFAAVAIVAGISWCVVNSRKGDEFAESNKTNQVVVLPTAEKTPRQSNADSNKNNQPDEELRPANQRKPSGPELAVSNSNNSNSQVVKASTSNNQRPSRKIDNQNSPKNNNVNRSKDRDPKLGPKVIEEEEEDNTLRLAEIFEEIDTK